MTRVAALTALLALITSCAGVASTGRPPPPSAPGGSTDARHPTTASVDPAQAARLQRVMLPLLRVMDHPVPLDQIRVGVLDDPQINAANAGGGQFFVTTGLLNQANDDRLRGVLAHEIPHQDLNHVAQTQVLGAGLDLGAAILTQIFPAAGTIAPLAGELVALKYSRDEEYAADRHGVELLRRAGYPKTTMVETLTWLMQASGPGRGGFPCLASRHRRSDRGGPHDAVTLRARREPDALRPPERGAAA